MDLRQAEAIGAVSGEKLVDIKPLVDDNGVAVVPYGVTSLGRQCLRYDVKILFIPETVEALEERLGGYLPEFSTIVSYQGMGIPDISSYHEGVVDLRFIKRFAEFPPFVNKYEKMQNFIVGDDFEIIEIQNYHDGSCPVEVIGNQGPIVAIDGALYKDNGETLVYYPQPQGPSSVISLSDKTTAIGKRAFSGVRAKKLTLSENVATLEAEAFETAHINEIVIKNSNINLEIEERPTWRDTYVCGPFSCFFGKEIKYPEGMECFSRGAFLGASSISKLNIPKSVHTIEKEAFRDNRDLALFIPDTVRSVDPHAICAPASLSLPSCCSADWAEVAAAVGGGSVIAIRGSEENSFTHAHYRPCDDLNSNTQCRLGKGYAPSAIDECFMDGSIKKFNHKIRIALTRLAMAGDASWGPSEEAMEEYRKYVAKNAKKAAKAFEGEKDGALCAELLTSLGYSVNGLLSKAKKEAATKKRSLAELCADAIELMKKGDASGLGAIEKQASKVRPAVSLELLVNAAVKGDEALIDRLYDIFGSFEMPCIALSRAVACGNDSAARALFKHGASFDDSFEPIEIKGDTYAKQENRRNKYLRDFLMRRDVDGNPESCGLDGSIFFMTLSSKSEPLLKAYASEGLLTPREMKGFILASLVDAYERPSKPKRGLAKRLYKEGGNVGYPVALTFQGGRQGHYFAIDAFEDLIFPGCSIESVEAVCSIMPERVNDMWDVGLLRYEPEIIKAMLPHLKSEGFANTAALLNYLARNDMAAEIGALENWGAALPEKALTKAAEIASSAGSVSATAALIELKSKLYGSSGENNLAL